MQKVFVLSKDATFIRNLELVLDKQRFQIEKPEIHINTLFSYCCTFKPDICIVHHSYVGGFYQVFDMLVSSKKCRIFYFSALNEIGLLYNVISSPRFYMLEEDKVMGINQLIDMMGKDVTLIESMESELNKYKEKIEEERMVRKAKLAIMKYKGCSEDEAYKAILKKSMDERISKLLAAKKIFSEVER